MDPTTILLVRHGETAWNAEGRIQGQTNSSLNERGREQARTLA
jgi:probable phosphoglycerate mutase